MRSESRDEGARWLASGHFDVGFYSALRGRSFPSPEAAAQDFVDVGLRQRLSPHPFLAFTALPAPVRKAWRRGLSAPVRNYLSSHTDLFQVPPGSPTDIADPAVRAARSHMMEVARRLAEEHPVSPLPLNWPQVEGEVQDRREGCTSVIIPTFRSDRMTARAVQAIQQRSGHQDVDVVVVDDGSPVPIALSLESALLGADKVRVARLPRHLGHATACNVGFAVSHGEVVVFLISSTEVRRGWLPPLLAALEDPAVAGAQPLLLQIDDTIRSAGLVYSQHGAPPCHLLHDHPREDALRVAGERFDTVEAAALAMRAVDFAGLRGFDPALDEGYEHLDLSLRVLPSRPGGFRVVPSSLVTHPGSTRSGRNGGVRASLEKFPAQATGAPRQPGPEIYERLGFRLEHLRTKETGVRSPVVSGRIATHPHSLRWAIKLPSTAGHWGDEWGDTAFAEALGRALRTLGHDVVTYRRGAHSAEMTRLDDVSLAIRGAHRIPASEGALNVLWVISHPDDVGVEEFEGYDLVFAASHSWSAKMTEVSGRPVAPLLQATRITPEPLVPTSEQQLRAVFVGNSNNGRERPLVALAVEAGVPLAVYGRGWEGRLPDGVWQGEYIDSSELPGLYRRRGLVIADHWPDMAREGFVANRVFDAVACGASVLSDGVVGLEALFPGAVRVCHTAPDVRDHFTEVQEMRRGREPPARADAFPHSFDARAARLSEAVLELRSTGARV